MQQLFKKRQVFRLTGSREPLDFVFVGAWLKAKQFGEPVEDIAQRIRKIQLANWRELILLAAEQNRGAEVSSAIDAQHRSRWETRRKVGRRCMSRMMFHNHDLAVREARTQF